MDGWMKRTDRRFSFKETVDEDDSFYYKTIKRYLFFFFTNGKLCHQFESLKPIATVTSKPKWLAFRKLAIKYIWGHANK